IEHHRAQEALHPEENGLFQRLKGRLLSRLTKWMPRRRLIVPIYLVLALGGGFFCYVIIGKDLLPKTNTGQLQLRLREPDGTRLEITEKMTQDVLGIIDSTVN